MRVWACMSVYERVCVCLCVWQSTISNINNLPIINIKRFEYEKGVKNNLCDATSCAECPVIFFSSSHQPININCNSVHYIRWQQRQFFFSINLMNWGSLIVDSYANIINNESGRVRKITSYLTNICFTLKYNFITKYSEIYRTQWSAHHSCCS